MKYKFLLYSVFASIFISCSNTSEEKSQDAYFGGHIVNPTSEYIVISRDSSLVDTIYLSSENEFSYRLNDIETGLYNFQHSYENQVVHLAPGDSLLAWVNTYEFDETLHFSGIGKAKNNFIINLFLLNENNTQLVLDYYKHEPDRFGAITDSVKAHRLEHLDELVQENEITDEFVEIAKKMIQFEYNNLRERYTYLVSKYYQEYSEAIPEDFYDYRKNISFNEIDFQTNPDYLRLLENYLINYSMQDCFENPERENCYDPNDYENIIDRIELVDSLVDRPLIKNYLFNHFGSTGMVMGQNREELRAVLESLMDKNIPKDDFADLVTLGNIQLAFIPGINIGLTPVISAKGDSTRIRNFIDNRTMVYLWSIYSPKHHKEQHKTVDGLKEKYPEMDFMGINIDIAETSAWQNALQKYDYRMNNEFQLDTIQIMGRYVKSADLKPYLNKILFLDSSGTVVMGDANLNSPDFESHILEFLNQ